MLKNKPTVQQIIHAGGEISRRYDISLFWPRSFDDVIEWVEHHPIRNVVWLCTIINKCTSIEPATIRQMWRLVEMTPNIVGKMKTYARVTRASLDELLDAGATLLDCVSCPYINHRDLVTRLMATMTADQIINECTQHDRRFVMAMEPWISRDDALRMWQNADMDSSYVPYGSMYAGMYIGVQEEEPNFRIVHGAIMRHTTDTFAAAVFALMVMHCDDYITIRDDYLIAR